MPKLKLLSGEDIIGVFKSFDFSVVGQKGSHIKLRRITSSGIKQTLTVPKHQELDKGTIKAIYNQALRYVADEELKKYFYSD